MVTDTRRSAGRFWAIGGGKGGVGKSLVATNLAIALGDRHMEVILADGDLGGANLHTMFGIQVPDKTLSHFLGGKVAHLEDALLPTGHPRVRLLAGAGEFLGIADPDSETRGALLRELEALDADVVIIDLGAGTSTTTLDFWNFAGRSLMVCSPEPTSVQNTYSFLKMALLRRIDMVCAEFPSVHPKLHGPAGLMAPARSIQELLQQVAKLDPDAARLARRATDELAAFLVVNQAGDQEAPQIAHAIIKVSGAFLGKDVKWAGWVPDSKGVKRSVRKMRPYLMDAPPEDPLRRIFDGLAGRLLRGEALPEQRAKRGTQPRPRRSRARVLHSRPPAPRGARRSSKGQDIRLRGRLYHVHTEDLGPPRDEVVTVLYEEGRVVETKRTSYRELLDRGLDRFRVGEKLVERQHQAIIDALLDGRIGT